MSSHRQQRLTEVYSLHVICQLSFGTYGVRTTLQLFKNHLDPCEFHKPNSQIYCDRSCQDFCLGEKCLKFFFILNLSKNVPKLHCSMLSWSLVKKGWLRHAKLPSPFGVPLDSPLWAPLKPGAHFPLYSKSVHYLVYLCLDIFIYSLCGSLPLATPTYIISASTLL